MGGVNFLNLLQIVNLREVIRAVISASGLDHAW